MNQDDTRRAVLEAALVQAASEGFTDSVLVQAGQAAGVDAQTLLQLFPQGPESLVAFFSESADAAIAPALADPAPMKIRERIRTAVLARIEAIRPHKEAARRAAAFLLLPQHAPLAAKLVYRTVDTMWRAAGDTATDFNFYTKRAILGAVYSSTLMRWFNDASADEHETRDFLDARIDNVMQFEKLKAEMKARLPGLGDVLSGRKGAP
jgi:ubiquinone biosynthesis protein COQ9